MDRCLACRPTACGWVLSLVLGLLLAMPVAAQSPPDTTALMDSVRAAQQRVEARSTPSAADSAALRRWIDSTRTVSDAHGSRHPKVAASLLQTALRGARALHDTLRMAQVTTDLGNALYYQGNPEGAVDRWSEALPLHRRHDATRPLIVTLNNLGAVTKGLGHYREAEQYLQEAIALNRSRNDSLATANLISNLGNVYEVQALYDEARLRYEDALEIYRALDQPADVANMLNNLGLVEAGRGQYAAAAEYYRTALRMNRDLEDRPSIALNLNNLGIALRLQGDLDAALDRHLESLAISREIGDRDRESSTLNNAGLVHFWTDDYDRALTLYRRALEINRAMGDANGTASNLENIGEVYLEMNRPAHAVDTLEAALRLTEELRANASSPEARRALLGRQIPGYRSLTDAYLRLGRLDNALRSVEHTRARLLAEQLHGQAIGNAPTAGGPLVPEVPRAAALQATLSPGEVALLYADTRGEWSVLAVTADSIATRRLPVAELRARADRSYRDRLDRLRRTQGPIPASMQEHPTESPPRPAVDSLPSLSAVVRLYRAHLYDPRGPLSNASPASASVRRALARDLYDLLLAPAEPWLADADDLVIVPSGPLGYLPFETLRDASGRYLVERTFVRYAPSLTVLDALQARTYPHRVRPLLAVGGVAYRSESLQASRLASRSADNPLENDALGNNLPTDDPPADPSADDQTSPGDQAPALLRSARRRIERGASPAPTYARLGYRTWPDLPDTEREVRKLHRLTGRHATLITGADASEARLRRMSTTGQLDDYRYVHFATHGVVVPALPEISALVLAQAGASDSVRTRDGFLTMDEIASLNLKADVAVLSACETGFGRLMAGEGVLSLSHAFLRAGANATLVSQWKVADRSTRAFMTAVYRRARAPDTSFAEAVTATKRAFIDEVHGPAYTHPMHWAPFVYLGRE